MTHRSEIFQETIYPMLYHFESSFWVSLRTINKIWAFLLTIFVLFFHFALDAFDAQTSQIIIWSATHILYLFIVLYVREHYALYDTRWLRLARIVIRIIIISWLIYITPDTQNFLWVLYLIPISITLLTFDEFTLALFVLMASIGGMYLSMFGTATIGAPLSISMQQFVVKSTVLMIWTVFIYWLAEQIFTSRQNQSERYTSKTNLEKEYIIKNALVMAKRLSNADRILLIVNHPEKRHYIAHGSKGFGEIREGQSIDNLAKECLVLHTKRPFQTSHVWQEFKNGTIYNRYFTCNPQSIIAEPLFSKDGSAVIGVLTVAHDRPFAFDRLAKRAIRDFAIQLGSEFEDYIHFRQSLLFRAQAVESIAGFVHAKTTDEIAKVLQKEATNQFDGASIFLHRFDAAKNALVPWLSSNTIIDKSARSPMSPGKGIAGHAYALKEPIRIADVHQHPWFEEFSQEEKFRSLLTIPLLDPDNSAVYGTLSIHSKEEDKFELKDEQFGVRLCTQAAIALRKLNQFEEAKGYANRLQHILASLPTLDQLNQDGDQDAFYKQIVSLAAEILAFEAVVLHLIDPLKNEFVLTAAIGIPENLFLQRKGKRDPVKNWESFLKNKFKVGHLTYLVPGDAQEQEEISQEQFYTFHDKNTDGWDKNTVLFTLIKAEGHCLGRLAFDLPKSGYAPSPELINAMDVFGSMAAWALERNQMIKHRRDIMISISKGLAESEDWDTVGDIAVNAGAELLDTEGCSLYLVDDDSVILTHSNYQAINIGNSKPLSERDKCGLAAWVATTGKIFCSNNGEYKKHPAWSGEIEHLQLLESGACRHLLIMPITTLDEDHILGVVSFENKKGFSAGFDDDDQSLVQYMARHIAMAKRKVDRKGMIETWERWGLEDDLHELLNWQVLGVVAHLEAASTYLVQERYNKLHAMIPKILHNARSAANEIKSVHSMTLSQYLEIQNIKLALEKIRDMWVERIDQNRKLASIPVLCPPNLELPAPVRIVLLKVASNALLNAIEYSGALEDNNIRVQVSVTRNDDRVSLCVEDSGHGQHPLPKGYGITRMEQLVEQINQNKEIPYRLELELYSYPNKGTKVTLRARASRK